MTLLTGQHVLDPSAAVSSLGLYSAMSNGACPTPRVTTAHLAVVMIRGRRATEGIPVIPLGCWFRDGVMDDIDGPLRWCFREPIPEFSHAARLLDEAVTAHLSGDNDRAHERICAANLPEIRAWLESIWGAHSPYVRYRPIPNAGPLSVEERAKVRMPTAAEKQRLHQRDGFNCRFCGLPLIRAEVRQALAKAYPAALPWGRKNIEQHAAFQAMWAQYDHIVPHARGGTNDFGNIVLTCAACNFGRMNYLLEEVGLFDPRMRDPIQSEWDGLERVLPRGIPKPPEVILKVGAEGGSVTLYGRRAAGQWQFQRCVADQTPSFVDEPEIRHSSETASSWDEAIRLMDRYPWSRMFPIEIHPIFGEKIFAEFSKRQDEESISPQSVQRWRNTCGS